jgi:protein-S-isoprenylcysteine O-methyltransferase Ste14
MSALLGALGVICFAAFWWGAERHFRRGHSVPLAMKLTGFLSLSATLLFLLNLRHGLGPAWPAAAALFASALGLFVWTVRVTRARPPLLAFTPAPPSFLVQDGPYRLVRHPFYLAYMMFWLGTALAVPPGLGWAVPVMMGALYIATACGEEARFAASPLAADYAAYRRRVGMFFPAWRQPRAGSAVAASAVIEARQASPPPPSS